MRRSTSARTSEGDHSASCRSFITGTTLRAADWWGVSPRDGLMTGKCEASGADAPTVLAEATEAIQKATEAVQTTSRSIAKAVEAGRRAPAPPRRAGGGEDGA